MWHIIAVQEVSTKQEEEGSEGDNRCIPQDVVRNDRAHKHNEWIGWEERKEEKKQEVEKRASKLQSKPNNACISWSLESKKWHVGD